MLFSYVIFFKLDEDKQQFLNRWLPDALPEHVKVIVSTIEGTTSHQMLRSYETRPAEIKCGPLDVCSREVNTLLFSAC